MESVLINILFAASGVFVLRVRFQSFLCFSLISYTLFFLFFHARSYRVVCPLSLGLSILAFLFQFLVPSRFPEIWIVPIC